MLDRLRRDLAREVSGQSLAVVRVGLGLSIAYIAGAFLLRQADGMTALERLVTDQRNVCHLPYPGLEWIRPLGEPWMQMVLWSCVVASLLMAAGVFYRAATATAFFTLTYFWLTDQTLYGNHFALASTLALLMCGLPAARALRLTNGYRWLVGSSTAPPDTDTAGVALPAGLAFSGGSSAGVPLWSLWLLRAQVWLIYFFGGLTKIHPDWLAGEPIRLWYRGGLVSQRLAQYAGPQVARALRPLMDQEATVYAIAWGGLVFDLTIGTLLLVRRTRLLGIVCLLFFHVHNFFLIDRVGIVAPMALVAATVLLEPDWPSRLASWLRRPRLRSPDWGWFVGGLLALPPVGATLGWKLDADRSRSAQSRSEASQGHTKKRPAPVGWPLLAACGLWLMVQVLVPLRHYCIAGDAYWTDEGVRMSWFLMTRNKVGDFARFEVVDPALQGSASTAEAVRLDAAIGPDERPEITFRQVDARCVNWRDLPQWFVVYEPVLGERIVCRLPAGVADGPRRVEQEQMLLAAWREKGLGEARLLPCRPLLEVLADLRDRIAHRTTARQEAARALALLRIAQQRATRLAEPSLDAWDRRRQFRGLTNRLEQLLQLPRLRRLVVESLRTVRPLDLQGNFQPSDPLYVVVSRRLSTLGPLTLFRVRWQRWPEAREAVADLDCMMFRDLRPLPKWLIVSSPEGTHPGRTSSLRLLANPTRDLNTGQLVDLARTPMVAHAYAQFLANRWQARCGRRPQVFASAYAQLNHHPLQPILDARVDLAARPYLWCRHNSWILPLHRAEAGTTRY